MTGEKEAFNTLFVWALKLAQTSCEP